MKIAKYMSKDTEVTFIDKVEGWIEGRSDYIRLTEPVEADFIDLPKDVIVPLQVASLEEAKRAADIAYQAVIATIDERISKLMAITDQS